MSAYVVMMRERTTNPEEMSLYSKQALLAREGHAITPVARYGVMKVLEGPAFEGCLIHKFPSVQAAEAWYHSSQYQDAAQHRHKGAEYRVFIIEGLDEAA